MKIFWRIMGYAKPYKSRLALHVIFMLVSIALLAASIAFLDTIIKLLFSDEAESAATQIVNSPFDFLSFFNNMIIDIILEKGKLASLGFALLLVVSINFVGNIFKYLATYQMNIIRTKMVEDLRRDVFYNITKLQIAYFEGERKGDIMTRLISDLQVIELSVVITLNSIVRDPFTLIAFLSLMIISSPQLTIFIFIFLPVLAFIVNYVGKSLRKDSNQAQERLSWIMSVIDEFSGGIRIIKAFNAENYVKNIFRRYNKGYSKFSRHIQHKQRAIPIISEILGVATMGGFLWYGGKQVFEGDLQSSLIITFVFFFQQMIQPAKKLTDAYGNIMKGVASGERLFKLKDSPILIRDRENPKSLISFEKEISYEQVHFAYNTEDVLKDISFKIPKGQFYALVGPSGGGKSTLAELLLRFYDVRSGGIKIDGIDLRDLKLHDLRSLCAIVTQDPILFNDSIFNNIAFGLDNANEEKVINAAKAANAHEFIIETPEGYQTNIGDRGTLLSGGQRQRLSIARAILKNPPILILDEATSALDTKSEQIVQDALYKLMKNRTSLVIAHRLSTIQHADNILVIEQGRIAEQGKHNELIQKNGVYKSLYDLQQLDA